jgi:hypothetical protein
MEHLIIAKTKHTLEVDFNADTGLLKMSGSSYPENAIDFFGPIINWIKNYITQVKKPITMNLKLNYLNTSSTKCVLDIFEILEQFYQDGGVAEVNWYYEEEDEDILETGEELTEDIEFPVNFFSYKE